MAWVRLYTETKNDRKIRRLCPEHRWLWCVLLMMAKESPHDGWLLVAEEEPATTEDIADEANLPVDTVENGLGTFRELSLVEEVDGILHLVKWNKRQFKSDSSTPRTRKHKENQREQEELEVERSGNGAGTNEERRGNVPGTPPEDRVQSNNPPNPPYGEIVSYLNENADTEFKPSARATKRHINARWDEGFRLDDFKAVIDLKVSDWKGDPKMDKYLRPATLFCSKFESYLNEAKKQRSPPAFPRM